MLKFFSPRHDNAIKSHLGRLYHLATCDSALNKEEEIFIRKVGANAGLEPLEMDRILVQKHFYNDSIPLNKVERFKQLNDLISLSLVDGDLNSKEYETCEALAIQLGFSHFVFGVIIDRVLEGLKQNLSFQQIKLSCASYLVF